MFCEAPLGVSRMEEDVHSGNLSGAEVAGLPSGYIQTLGLQRALLGLWQP